METIQLLGQTPSRKPIEAVFALEKGMNLLSLRIAERELIDLSTKYLFDERAAGLGALIGPHFHHRPPERIVAVHDKSLFSHLQTLKTSEPFSHGIARYVPWRLVHRDKESLVAEIQGDMKWRGVSYRELEGFDFRMVLEANLVEWGVMIGLQLWADQPSVCGMHYYYKKGQEIRASVQPSCRSDRGLIPIPPYFHYENHAIRYRFEEKVDHGFFAYPDSRMVWVTHHFGREQAHVRAVSTVPLSWQLWYPDLKSSFVCIEPLSATDPRNPQKKNSNVALRIEIEE